MTPPLRLVFWETTAGCNLECSHCRRLDVSRELMKNDLNAGDAMWLVQQIAEFAKPILVLSGGEPLMRPDVFDIVRFADWRGLTVSLATNGTLLDDAMARRIAQSPIRRVAISIDGADAKTHDDFRRQPGSLARALDGFRRLRSLGVSMQINVTVSRHNRHQIDEIYRMARELGADALHVFVLVPVGCGMQIAPANMLSGQEVEEVLTWMHEKSRDHQIHLKATCAPQYFRIAIQRGDRPKGHGMEAMTRGCLAGSGVCFISHTGEVFPCGYLPVSAGNIRTRPLQAIWERAPVFHQLRDPDQLEGKCGACEFRKVCMGCRARAYAACGNLMQEEPYCSYQPCRTGKSSTCTS